MLKQQFAIACAAVCFPIACALAAATVSGAMGSLGATIVLLPLKLMGAPQALSPASLSFVAQFALGGSIVGALGGVRAARHFISQIKAIPSTGCDRPRAMRARIIDSLDCAIRSRRP